jgi:hypothetical protein
VHISSERVDKTHNRVGLAAMVKKTTDVLESMKNNKHFGSALGSHLLLAAQQRAQQQ